MAMALCFFGALPTSVFAQSFAKPPYYSGRGVSSQTVAWFPIAYQRGANQPPVFDPSVGSEMQALLAEMNAYLDSLMSGPRIELPSTAPGAPPDVRLACAMDFAGDCLDADDEPSTPAERPRSMTLHVERGSRDFRRWLGPVLSRAGASHAVMITLEVAPFWPRQTGLRGNKVVDLGTDYSQQLPWLTSLDDPIWVVELTGAVLDPKGDVKRFGAEGVYAKRTRFAISAIGGEESVGDDDIAMLRTLQREDVDGKPLAWRASLELLLRGLLGSSNR